MEPSVGHGDIRAVAFFVAEADEVVEGFEPFEGVSDYVYVNWAFVVEFLKVYEILVADVDEGFG